MPKRDAASGVLRLIQGKNDNTEREEVEKRNRQFTVYNGGGAQVYAFEPRKQRDVA